MTVLTYRLLALLVALLLVPWAVNSATFDPGGSGGGDALTSNPLSQFAATTSAQLAGVISNETGSGLLVFATSPVLTTPNLGTPSALTLTNATGLPQAGTVGLTTADSPQFTGVNVGHATDTTVARSAAGVITVEGVTVTRTIASGAKALATGAIGSAACTSAQTDTATGAATTDTIIATFNADPTAVTGYVPLTTGMLTIIVYPTTDTFNAKVCNNTSSSITPGAITLNWKVIR